jgi:ribosomal protein S18 acetylase RimI-like enzyme
MSDMSIQLRDAGPADLDAVATLFLDCWRVSYAGVLPEPVIAVFDEHSARALWRRALETPPAGSVGIVAESTTRGVLGIVRMGTDPDEPSAGHVFSLYVDPAAQGLGVGGRLLDEATRRLRVGGKTQATLWVFEANVQARAFYRHRGWQPDGGERVEPDFGEPELRLRRASL